MLPFYPSTQFCHQPGALFQSLPVSMASSSPTAIFVSALLLFALATSCAPVSPRASGLTITAAQVLQIAPTSGSCANAPYADECKTAAQAAPLVTAAFAQYGVSTLGVAAALLSTMAFESGDFKYQKNHFPAPGRPGQGTRNMQSAAFNVEYAGAIPALQAQVASLTGGAATGGLSADKLNAVRQLVLADPYDFASAAWFFNSQCGAPVKSALQAGGTPTAAAWQQYVSGCVGTTVTDDRMAYWTRAVAALGGSGTASAPASSSSSAV